MTKRFGFFGLLGVVALGLSACSSTDAVAPPPCPEILIPVDSAQLTRFKPGPGRDIIDVVHEEKVTGFAHRCEYDTDAQGAGSVLVELYPSFESARGPANQAGKATFEFFVAIVDQDKNMLEKARFPTVIEFPQNMSRISWQREEAVALKIPLKAGQIGGDMQVYLGLQLTRDELNSQIKAK